MEIKKLDFSHSSLLRSLNKNIKTYFTEYSFPNLYLFREKHEFSLVKITDFLFISGKTHDNKKYIQPYFPLTLEDFSSVYTLVCNYQQSLELDFIYPVSEDLITDPDKKPDISQNSEESGFLNLSPVYPNVSYNFNKGDSEYVYDLEKMQTLSGRKLHSKRNLINYFRENYRSSVRAIIPETFDDALSVLENWQEKSGELKQKTDYHAAREGILLSEELVLCGVIYYINNVPSGFILGEELNNDSFVLHFAKADSSVKGLYQYMFQSFSQFLPSKYKWLNLEQDLGDENLRKAKLSYYPEKIMNKYRVYFPKSV